MLKILKNKYPDKEFPSNIGKTWTEEEDALLLEELSNNIDIESIANAHNRTIGGINARRGVIAYKLYSNNISMEEIIVKTKLDEYKIIEIINKREIIDNKKSQNNITKNKPILIESEIYEIKNDIKELKNTIKELVEMIKSIYEFEDA